MNTLKGLYAIADAECIGTNNVIEKVNEVVATGVKLLQYRDKVNSAAKKTAIARELRSITKNFNCRLIINDDVALANSVGADGVHLGKDDISIIDARKILGPNKIIGASCYNQIQNAYNAQAQSADYVAFGSIYHSSTKPDAPTAELKLVRKAKNELNVSICVIGGITIKNILPVLQSGADLFAVISAIFNSTNPGNSTKDFLKIVQEFDLTA